MAIGILRGKSDEIIDRFIEALRPYEVDQPDARIDLYRHNPVSVRVRIVDPGFADRSKVDRHNAVWKYLDVLPDEVQSALSSLTLLTPEETSKSFANLEFEDPVPSGL